MLNAADSIDFNNFYFSPILNEYQIFLVCLKKSRLTVFCLFVCLFCFVFHSHLQTLSAGSCVFPESKLLWIHLAEKPKQCFDCGCLKNVQQARSHCFFGRPGQT